MKTALAVMAAYLCWAWYSIYLVYNGEVWVLWGAAYFAGILHVNAVQRLAAVIENKATLWLKQLETT